MLLKSLKEAFLLHKETSLRHRYICSDHITPLIEKLPEKFRISIIGESALGEPIFSITFGKGSKKILMWSQMHGNESTTTKAIFDLLNTLVLDQDLSKRIESDCQITLVPMLNPDGARMYTRENANGVDLNRDAQNLSESESRALRSLYDLFKPDYCFNLHGQRTIFSAGITNRPATISFLSPAADKERSLTDARLKAIELITILNDSLQLQIPGQVGIYDDSFNLDCVGDTFQSLGSPTILFEAGHYQNDYARDITREFIYQSLLISILTISKGFQVSDGLRKYQMIPQNQKCFYDIIIRNALLINESKVDIGVMYKETLIENNIEFHPKIEKIGDLNNYYGHLEVNANNVAVLTHKKKDVFEGYANDFVYINDELFSLKLINS